VFDKESTLESRGIYGNMKCGAMGSVAQEDELAHSGNVEEWSEEEDRRPWPGNRPKTLRK
jgi:hypothetical protein